MLTSGWSNLGWTVLKKGNGKNSTSYTDFEHNLFNFVVGVLRTCYILQYFAKIWVLAGKFNTELPALFAWMLSIFSIVSNVVNSGSVNVAVHFGPRKKWIEVSTRHREGIRYVNRLSTRLMLKLFSMIVSLGENWLHNAVLYRSRRNSSSSSSSSSASFLY